MPTNPGRERVRQIYLHAIQLATQGEAAKAEIEILKKDIRELCSAIVLAFGEKDRFRPHLESILDSYKNAGFEETFYEKPAQPDSE